MPDQYFTENPSAAHETRFLDYTFAGKALRFETDAGVFSKAHLDKGTALLLSALPEVFSGRALDLGCGWGAVGACMAAKWPGAKIVMTDINARAAALSARNMERNGLRATVLQGDGLSHIEGAFDLIAINPPIRAGKAVVYRLFEECLTKLRPDGALLIVMRKQQGADSAKRFLLERLSSVETVARGGGFHVFKAS